MLRQYCTIIGCRYEANANVANGNPILSQCGLTRECQRQFRQWETNVGLIYSCCLWSLKKLLKSHFLNHHIIQAKCAYVISL